MSVNNLLAGILLALLPALPAAAQWHGAEPAPSYGQQGFQTRPNIFGGVTIDQGIGRPQIQTRPNIFGGYNIAEGGRPTVTCTPNIFGGVNCR
jgi:hypothetical protein